MFMSKKLLPIASSSHHRLPGTVHPDTLAVERDERVPQSLEGTSRPV